MPLFRKKAIKRPKSTSTTISDELKEKSGQGPAPDSAVAGVKKETLDNISTASAGPAISSIPAEEVYSEVEYCTPHRRMLPTPPTTSSGLAVSGHKRYSREPRRLPIPPTEQGLYGLASERNTVWSIAWSIENKLQTHTFRMFRVFPDQRKVVLYCLLNKIPLRDEMGDMNQISERYMNFIQEVACEGCFKRLIKNVDGVRFPNIISNDLLKSIALDDIIHLKHVLLVPLFNGKRQPSFIIEMWRSTEFYDEDEDIANLAIIWGSSTLHHSSVLTHMTRQRKVLEFMLNVAKAMFNNLVDLEQLIKRILEFAQKLVNADRASLFLVDNKTKELVSTVFDLQIEKESETNISKKEIRMPITKGIAGYVATCGNTVNISDAYADKRFNRDVDEATGYKTTSILCMPIEVEGRIIGVVQMVNKRSDDLYEKPFSREDELNFENISTLFGLALQQARLYDKIRCKEQKYKVALEVLGYHNTCRESDVKLLLADKKNISIVLDDFYLNPYNLDPDDKCKAMLCMFQELFGFEHFDRSTFTRFVLSVRKNYRDVPYHNFNHGWSVAHTMYMMLKNNKSEGLDINARLALFIAALCHDLDHRGFTNKFMIDSKAPLAVMYSTSTLEHHHFNISVTLLHQEGHNFLSHVQKDDFKSILDYIKKCILATDLATFFPNLTKLKTLVGDQQTTFDWTDTQHRDMAMALSMTAADLSASAKPWDVQIKTVEVIFEEFYTQGDLEKAAGREPIPMMDRTKLNQRSPSQVGFLSHICLPCYDILTKIIPETEPLLRQAKVNFELWKSKAEDDERNEETTVDNPENEQYSDDDSDVIVGVFSPYREKLTWDSEQSDVVVLSSSVGNLISGPNMDGFEWLEDDDSMNIALRRNSK